MENHTEAFPGKSPAGGGRGRDERLAAIFAECSDRLNAREAIDFDEIVAAHPELAPDLADLLQSLRALEWASHREPALEQLGDYRILREIGRGGMGIVYEAHQASMDRRVALKVLPASLVSEPKAVLRFQREAKVASRIDHPGICPVYDAGVADGIPYIAMRFIEGESLSRKLSRAREALTPRRVLARLPGAAGIPGIEAAPEDTFEEREKVRETPITPAAAEVQATVRLIEKAARSLHAAHEAGYVHRDVKPGNILVTPEGDPVILDFGLARGTEDEPTTLTLSGVLLGTPAYMSPEQIAARRALVDRRTDVYSLGVTLYECLTLRLPFDAPTRDALYQKILTTDPPDPRRLNRRISKDLKVVLETALEKSVDRRYRTALEFAEDLRRVREHEPVRARPAGPWLRFERWAQRNPVVATATLASFLFLAAGLAGSLLLLDRVRTEKDAKAAALVDREAALVDKDAALVDREKALSRAEGLRLAAESRSVLPRNPGLALLLAIEGARRYPGAATSSEVLAALEATRESRVLFGHALPVSGACFSPDGKRVATACQDRTAKVWDADSGQLLLTLCGHMDALISVAYSPDGRRLATSCHDWTARIWDADSGKELRVAGSHTNFVVDVAFSPDGRRLLTASHDRTAKVWDAVVDGAGDGKGGGAGGGTGDGDHDEALLTLPHSDLVGRSGFSPDGKRIVTSSNDKLARIWDANTGDLLKEIPHPDEVSSASFSPDSRRIVTGSRDGKARVFDAESGKEVFVLSGHAAEISGARFNHDGTRIITSSADHTARIWDAATGAEIDVLRGHAAGVMIAAFGPNGRRAITGSEDKTARLWDLSVVEVPRAPPVVRKHRDRVGWVTFSPDGRRLATASDDGTAAVIDAEDGREVAVLEHGDHVYSVEFSPDGGRVITGCRDQKARIWDVPSGKIIVDLRGHTSAVFSACFSPDGRRALTAASRSGVKVWDAATGREIASFPWWAESAAFSPDGRTVAIVPRRGPPAIYDPDTGRLLASLSGGPIALLSLALSPDGSRLAAGGEDKTVRLWDVRSGQPLASLKGHDGRVARVRFSGDGRYVLTASEDRTARLWDAASGEALAILREDKSVTAWAFSPDLEHIAVGSADGTVRVRRIDAGAGRVEAAVKSPFRELTPDERDIHGVGTPEERKAWREAWDLRLARTRWEVAGKMIEGDPEKLWLRREYSAAFLMLFDAIVSPSAQGPDPAQRAGSAQAAGEALALARTAVEKTGRRDARLLWYLARALEVERRFAEAVTTIEEALRLPRDRTDEPEALRQLLARCRAAIQPDLASFASIDARLERLDEEAVVDEGATWRSFPGTQEPSPGIEWTEGSFADASWREGPAGDAPAAAAANPAAPAAIPGISTPVPAAPEAMPQAPAAGAADPPTALYLRRAFRVAEPSRTKRYRLAVDVPGGFAAYLNGREVARSRAGEPGAAVPFDALADPNTLGAYRGPDPAIDPSFTRSGENVLAIVALRASRAQSSFTVTTVLRAELLPDPGRDLKLLEAFRAAARDPGARLQYLEGRLLSRRGEHGEAAKRFAEAAHLSPRAHEPVVRLAESLAAQREFGAAEARLREALEGPFADCGELWDQWVRLELVEMKKGPAEALAALPRPRPPSAPTADSAGTAADRRDDIEWLLGRLQAEGAVRVSCGSEEEHTSPSGIVWGRDRFYLGGSRVGTAEDIAGTDEDALYQDLRLFWEDGAAYRFPLPPGKYHVALHFSEHAPNPGYRRIFHVLLQGSLVIENFDPVAAGPGANTAIRREFEAEVRDGFLEIGLFRHYQGSMIAAIEILGPR